ncbi:MAG TPA: hemolysin family protein, partial [Bacteroidales bacterium]|nr:hemolysin family protein [Bacteroidales bacterium]
GSITYLSLVIGELVPKSIALSSPERIAITLSPAMSGVTIIVYPFVWVLTSSTKIINRTLGIKTNETRFMTEEEIRQIIKQSSEQGVIDEDETQMIKEVFRFGETRVHELMTHRKKISYIELNDSIHQIIDKIETENHSKYLLCKEDIENVIGTIAVKDLLKIVYKGHITSTDLTDVAKSPLYLPESLTAQKALELFRENKKNFGIVISEYGGVEGILTLHDLTETILGEIPEESEEANDIITKREDGSMLVNGSMHINDFMEAMNIVKFDDIEESGFNTMGGMAMHLLGKVPSETDKFTYNGFQFEVIDMDGSRVDKILVTRATEID